MPLMFTNSTEYIVNPVLNIYLYEIVFYRNNRYYFLPVIVIASQHSRMGRKMIYSPISAPTSGFNQTYHVKWKYFQSRS